MLSRELKRLARSIKSDWDIGSSLYSIYRSFDSDHEMLGILNYAETGSVSKELLSAIGNLADMMENHSGNPDCNEVDDAEKLVYKAYDREML